MPQRMRLALERGDLTLEGFALLTYLILDADERGESAKTLAVLAGSVGWSKSGDSLLRLLGALRSGGWVDFESKRGQRKPYVIRLTGAATASSGGDLRTTSAPDTPSHAEVTSASRMSAPVVKPLVERARPPHDVRSEELLRREQIREDQQQADSKGAAAEFSAQELDDLVAELAGVGWTMKQLASGRTSPAQAKTCLAEARARGVKNIGGYAWSLFNADPVKQAAEEPSPRAGADALHTVMKSWLKVQGAGTPTFKDVEAEIKEREYIHKTTLDPDQRQELFEIWLELQPEQAPSDDVAEGAFQIPVRSERAS